MKRTKIYCDHCGEDVFPETEEETYFSIKYFKYPQQEFHLCELCRKELNKFFKGVIVTDVKDPWRYGQEGDPWRYGQEGDPWRYEQEG